MFKFYTIVGIGLLYLSIIGILVPYLFSMPNDLALFSAILVLTVAISFIPKTIKYIINNIRGL